jgi:hypothetical protein
MSSNNIYFVYQTTNQINGKVYVGVHKTTDINDGYVGSGINLQRAIKKYGIGNFTREILCFTETYSEAFEIEELIVDHDFINSPNTYNMKLGGHGGFDHITLTHTELKNRASNGGRKSVIQKIGAHNQKYDKQRSIWLSKSLNTQKSKGLGLYNPEIQTRGFEASLSIEARTKRIQTLKSINHQQGAKNSQYGTMWIYNSSTLECKKIPKDALIPEGYIKGRRMPKNNF